MVVTKKNSFRRSSTTRSDSSSNARSKQASASEKPSSRSAYDNAKTGSKYSSCNCPIKCAMHAIVLLYNVVAGINAIKGGRGDLASFLFCKKTLVTVGVISLLLLIRPLCIMLGKKCSNCGSKNGHSCSVQKRGDNKSSKKVSYPKNSTNRTSFRRSSDRYSRKK